MTDEKTAPTEAERGPTSEKKRRRLMTKRTWTCFGSALLWGSLSTVIRKEGIPEAIGAALAGC